MIEHAGSPVTGACTVCQQDLEHFADACEADYITTGRGRERGENPAGPAV